MPLLTGDRLGLYEILAPIGAGGMGEVYRARDTKLKREVALKVLPDSFASDPERMARFQREAEVLASLNHPHIAQIYGVEERALVMELVEGEMLQGPLPMETALSYARQIADALEAAHEKGIIHRDLKPANIMITPAGVVKVLDFGLAAIAQSSAGEASNPANSPTLTISPTRAGMIMGTAAYMSPEQARGKPVDRRSDIFAFGVVLYEMLTGRQAFAAETIPDTLAAVLTKEPPLDQLPESTPAGIRRLVERCLQKDVRKRLQAIGDARIEIDESLAGKDSRLSPLPEGKVHARPLSRWSTIVIVGSAAAVVAVVLGYWLTRSAPSPKVLDSTQITRDGLQKTSPFNFQSLWTDGSRLYFNEGANGSWGIAQVSALGGETLPFSTSISTPILLSMAPNRSELLVQSLTSNAVLTSLWAVPILGGTPRRIGDLRANDGAFSPDGQHMVYIVSSDIYRANLDGTGSRKLVTVSGVAFYPRFSPDGSILRFTMLDSKTNSVSIWEIRSDGTGLHPILPDWNKPHNELCGSWTPDGRYYVFEAVRGGTGNSNLWALREKGGLLEGSSREPIQLTSGPFDFHMAVPDPNGHKLYVIGVQQRGELVRYDAKSRQFQPFLSAIGAEQLDFSSDGKWVTYTLYPEGSLWRSKLDGSERLQLTFPPAQAIAPRWSPDGKRIAFSIKMAGKPLNVYSLSVDGGAPEQLTTGGHVDIDPSWSADGESLAFGEDPTSEGRSSTLGIRILNLKTRQVSILPGSEGLWRPSFSPDGRHISALAADSQAIMLFDVATQKWTELARTAVNSPTWSRDGQYIYFDSYPTRDAAIFRLRINDHKLERVTNLEGLRRAESSVFSWPWMSLTADDSPILLRDNGTQEIYALDLQLP
jgi:serine/threonine protein kinase/Tol biopolymer transport system component